ncbi:50S ribosomal protein L29 [Candidatus Daviesbacteria bacterium]|nr:50S ribosomal protein L29 [Candidatus Daviesbacteria bacterium]
MTKLRDFKNEIKVLDIEALVQKAKALKVNIGDLILDKNTSKLKDLKSISKKKKELARVLTVLSQKIMIEQLEKVSQVAQVPQVPREEKEEKSRDTLKKGGKQ